MAAALAANACEDIAELEEILERTAKVSHYKEVSDQLKKALVKELPYGFWDSSEKRFIDWVDRNSKVHDHIHLLANELPVLFHYVSKGQEEGVEELLEKYRNEFQRLQLSIGAVARIGDVSKAAGRLAGCGCADQLFFRGSVLLFG